MKSLFPNRRENVAAETTFVTEREAAKLTEMLAIATKDLDAVSGGVAASLACCCCHHGSLA
jgi:hypothetical protein